jgi:hypothetical protein
MAPEYILKTYELWDETNTLNSVNDFMPPELAEVFKAHKGLHLLIDEFANYMFNVSERIRAARDKGVELRSQLVELRHMGMHVITPGNVSVIDGMKGDRNRTPDATNILSYFIKCHCFSAPCTVTQAYGSAEGFVEVGSDEAEDSSDPSDIDVHKSNMDSLEEMDNKSANEDPMFRAFVKMTNKSNA